ncbi:MULTISPECIES: hypothetical protein [unclassified Beijerinckia]|uniref:hypothetical protein n=1 Tax=unclassified Beijerinckia TaxID=2638183 RepID=UPI00089BF517|nr:MULTISPECIES: hypothetical protein [unclassified Beijerinckia]MDH7794303.1 Mg/Co/Ni transporter MgtE [Beijerinckia sp. GAS462]SEB58275.1 hypothetical protein SAMN05443249_0572 [Beijerinckia sp. 28-YEA-48]
MWPFVDATQNRGVPLSFAALLAASLAQIVLTPIVLIAVGVMPISLLTMLFRQIADGELVLREVFYIFALGSLASIWATVAFLIVIWFFARVLDISRFLTFIALAIAVALAYYVLHMPSLSSFNPGKWPPNILIVAASAALYWLWTWRKTSQPS